MLLVELFSPPLRLLHSVSLVVVIGGGVVVVVAAVVFVVVVVVVLCYCGPGPIQCCWWNSSCLP